MNENLDNIMFAHPGCVPSGTVAWENVQPGHFIQVRKKHEPYEVSGIVFNGERFWILVEEIDFSTDEVVGVVNNDLLAADDFGFDLGDTIRVPFAECIHHIPEVAP